MGSLVPSYSKVGLNWGELSRYLQARERGRTGKTLFGIAMWSERKPASNQAPGIRVKKPTSTGNVVDATSVGRMVQTERLNPWMSS
jgi:hypothetical protein